MIFADLLFLYAFLPINLLLYFVSKNKSYRNIVLVSFSLLFYAWGEPLMVLLLISTTVLNYLFALYIEKNRGTRKSKAVSIIAITLTLTLLGIFKYGGFIAENVSFIFGLNLPNTALSLPVGISFYSFQIISYIVDVYKGEVQAQKSCLKFLMYISLYPQLIAGPIVRYKTVMEEIQDRNTTLKDFSSGITRFSIGLAKKVIIANQAGEIAGNILSGDFAGLSILGAWTGIIMFALQIYYDFSGYSDMAIGLGRIFGFHFDENFNYPYISKSITEFWRRWHISLSGFFRDYVYIPLGGNRKHMYWNLLVVWLLTGLWHGASWNFVLWGLYFGLLISFEKAFLLKQSANCFNNRKYTAQTTNSRCIRSKCHIILIKLSKKFLKIIKHITTMFFVIFGWVIFYFTDFLQMLRFIKSLFGLNNAGVYDMVTLTSIYNRLFIIIVAIIFCTPVYKHTSEFLRNRKNPLRKARISYTLTITANAFFIVLCTVLLVGNTYNPFLYYKF